MTYFISFLEGIITFISPCLLPMLPVYISFFAGNNNKENDKFRASKNAVAFVAGFTIVFVLLGIFSAAAGRFLARYQVAVNIVTGLIVVIFGLNFIGLLKIPFLNKTFKLKANTKDLGIGSSLLFGIVFSIGWTPCVGTFLASALMLVSQLGGHPDAIAKGIVMMLCYSAGLGVPFIAAALLIDKLKSTFDFIKRHYKIINAVSGGLLVAVGILMMTGCMNYFLSLMTF